jgi:hypothetical protein
MPLEIQPYVMPSGPMTQRIRAEHLMSQISLPDDKQLVALEEVLGEAQNGPPQGGADGSISPEAWQALSEYITALRVARIRRKKFKESIS